MNTVLEAYINVGKLTQVRNAGAYWLNYAHMDITSRHTEMKIPRTGKMKYLRTGLEYKNKDQKVQLVDHFLEPLP